MDEILKFNMWQSGKSGEIIFVMQVLFDYDYTLEDNIH